MEADSSGDHLEVVYVHGSHGAQALGKSEILGGSVAGRVASTRRPVLIQGDDHEGAVPGVELARRFIHSSMCVPLLAKGVLVGVLNVNEVKGSKHFDAHDLEAIEFFADYAAIAIVNARRFEQERAAVTRLEELDRMKSDFVATISHELRTPLTSIISSAKLLTRKVDQLDAGQQREFLEIIDRQGHRLLRLVEDVMTTANLESRSRKMKRERVELRELCADTIRETEATKDGSERTFELSTKPEEPIGWGDAVALQQVLTNLVDNAVKYSEPGTRISISAQQLEHESIIEVADEGTGIPEEKLASIFDRFAQLDSSSTRKVGGVGLGLYIVKSIVEAQGGSIEIESVTGEGSTFRVRLPHRIA